MTIDREHHNKNFPFKEGQKVICISIKYEFLFWANYGGIYEVWIDCEGYLSIKDEQCILDKYAPGYRDHEDFILNTKLTRILMGIE